jgi:hypothetical protein
MADLWANTWNTDQDKNNGSPREESPPADQPRRIFPRPTSDMVYIVCRFEISGQLPHQHPNHIFSLDEMMGRLTTIEWVGVGAERARHELVQAWIRWGRGSPQGWVGWNVSHNERRMYRDQSMAAQLYIGRPYIIDPYQLGTAGDWWAFH